MFKITNTINKTLTSQKYPKLHKNQIPKSHETNLLKLFFKSASPQSLLLSLFEPCFQLPLFQTSANNNVSNEIETMALGKEMSRVSLLLRKFLLLAASTGSSFYRRGWGQMGKHVATRGCGEAATKPLEGVASSRVTAFSLLSSSQRKKSPSSLQRSRFPPLFLTFTFLSLFY